MKAKQTILKSGCTTLNIHMHFLYLFIVAFSFLHLSPVIASEQAIENLEFSSLSGNKVQIKLAMKTTVQEPTVFQTDNPARIALDFSGVTSHLGKKSFPINQGAVNTVYVVEAGGRTRVVINLIESVEYETRIADNHFYLVVNSVKAVSDNDKVVKSQLKQSNVSRFLPKQGINGIDFRRGNKGEGRLMISLTNPNTVVDVKERGGKVVLNFLNTQLDGSLAKKYDVIDFATPVKTINAQRRGNGVSITVATVNSNFDYSSFQSEGMLTVEFRPLSVQEKKVLLQKKFPFTGDKLSLNFQDIEVRSVLQILADFTELNIIASDSVGGSVTLRLNDVPWDQALALVLKSKGLAKRENGNVVFVAPSAEITKMEEEELAARKIVEKLEPLVTELVQINYAKAEEIQSLLTGQNIVKSQSSNTNKYNPADNSSASSSTEESVSSESDGMLSARGSSTVDSRTNTLIIRDTAKKLEEIRGWVKLLDVPVKQVIVEARIVIASTDFSHDLGVRFGVANKSHDNFGFSGTGVGNPGGSTSVLTDLGAALAATPQGALAMTLARGADYLLNLEIEASEGNSKAEIISNPRVMTSDRMQASIKSGVQIPYQTSSESSGPVTELVDAVLELNVTPQITPSGSIILELDIKKDNPGAPEIIGGATTLPIQTRQIMTTVQIEDGETVVLGGIYEMDFSDTKNKVPWFADLPGFGWMFKNKSLSDIKGELLIFVTPKIVKNTLAVN